MQRYYFFHSSRIGLNLAIIVFLSAFLEGKHGYVFPQHILFGLAFGLLGIGRVVVADRINKSVSESWRFFYIIRIWQIFKYPFSEVKSVTVKNYIKDIKNDGHEDIRVSAFLDLKNKKTQIILIWPYYRRSRKVGEKMASILDVKYRDRMFGVLRSRNPGDLNKNIAERLATNEKPIARPTIPMLDRLRVDEYVHGGRIRLDPKKMNIILVLLAQAVAVFLLILAKGVMPHIRLEGVVLFGLSIAISVYTIIRLFVAKYSIKLKVNKHRIAYKYGLFRGSIRIKAIEELYIANRLIHRIGDKKQMTLPFEAYDDEDKQISTYIVEFMKYYIRRNYNGK